MFSELKPAFVKRRDFAVLASFAVHFAILLALAYHAAPVFLRPSDVALGMPNSSGTGIIYLAPAGTEHVSKPTRKPELDWTAAAPKIPLPKQPPAHENERDSETATMDKTAEGGSPYGSRIPGAPLTGNEIIPALPQVFPDPNVSRADLPPGIQGDVIVEVTIDEQGNVVDLKLIRGIGYGIEERVMATLRQWHFRPASKDGVTIASQHIVSFHYPG
jgi:TonB family protein